MVTLPMDLIIEVLSHLPVKSLLRLKVVSKPWKNLITSTFFTNLHLQHSYTTNTNRFAIAINNCSRNVYLIGVDTPESLEVKLSIPLLPPQPPPPRNWLFKSFYNISICKGLVCICTRWLPIQIFLLNPLNAETFIQIQAPEPEPETFISNIYSGFGYDHINDDYKVVLLGHRKNFPSSEVRIYSLRENSWRSINAGDFSIMGIDLNGVLVNNHLLHWLIYSSKSKNYEIACLDLCSEKWKIISSPSGYYFFDVYKDCLCLIPQETYQKPASYAWLLKNECWIMVDIKFINPVSKLFYPCIISNTDDSKLSKLAQIGIKIPGEQCDNNRCSHIWRFEVFTGSLVTVGDGQTAIKNRLNQRFESIATVGDGQKTIKKNSELNESLESLATVEDGLETIKKNNRLSQRLSFLKRCFN